MSFVDVMSVTKISSLTGIESAYQEESFRKRYGVSYLSLSFFPLFPLLFGLDDK